MSKYDSIFNKNGRTFTCKFCNSFSVEIKIGGSTSSLTWHLENKHAEMEEVKQFFQGGATKKRVADSEESTPKRQRIAPPSTPKSTSSSKQANILDFGKFIIYFDYYFIFSKV
jgi:hypothetical protein